MLAELQLSENWMFETHLHVELPVPSKEAYGPEDVAGQDPPWQVQGVEGWLPWNQQEVFLCLLPEARLHLALILTHTHLSHAVMVLVVTAIFSPMTFTSIMHLAGLSSETLAINAQWILVSLLRKDTHHVWDLPLVGKVHSLAHRSVTQFGTENIWCTWVQVQVSKKFSLWRAAM